MWAEFWSEILWAGITYVGKPKIWVQKIQVLKIWVQKFWVQKIQVQKFWVQKIQVQKMNLRGKAKTAKSLIFMFSTKVYAPQKSAMLPVRRLLLD